MQNLGADAMYGLASIDETARLRAVGDVVQVIELNRTLAAAEGVGALRAVQVHSAPRSQSASEQVLSKSLTQILEALGADPVDIVIEHCDAQREGQSYEKGFLELEQEIRVVREIADPRVEITINWGRSAIEGQAHESGVSSYVASQVADASRAGVLKGLMFSGVAGTTGPWGLAWEDSHVAPYGDSSALAASHGSLLGAAEIKACLDELLVPLSYLGAKVTVFDAESDVQRCIDVASATLDLMSEAI